MTADCPARVVSFVTRGTYSSVVVGHCAYYAVPGNTRALWTFRYHVVRLWLRSLRRRSQRSRWKWSNIWSLADAWLPKPRVLHAYPEQRLRV